jgi:hypothetical protein
VRRRISSIAPGPSRAPLAARLVPALLLLLAALIAAALAAAEPVGLTRYVAPGGADGANLCANPAAPCATLRHALSRSAPGDTVQLAAGVYREAGLTVPHALTVRGAAGVALDGGGRDTLLTVAGGALTLENLTLRGGAGRRGGAVAVLGGAGLVVRAAIFEANTADLGGAIYVESGAALIEDSRLTGNTAELGGALYVGAGSLTVARSELSGNEAAGGGALLNGMGATTRLSRVRLLDNRAGGFGGGALNQGGALTLDNALLRGNRAGSHGGGLFNDGGAVAADFTTWLDNAAAFGGALGNRGETRLRHSVIAGSIGGACDRPLGGENNFIEDASCGPPARPPTGLLDDGRPTAASNVRDAAPPGPCAAANGAPLPTDLRGEPRPAGADDPRCDAGAFEFQPRLTIIHSPTLADGTRFGFGGDLGAFTLWNAAGDGAGGQPSGGQPRAVFEAAPGTYRVAQTREPGWKVTVIVCAGDADGGNLVDAAGSAVTIDLDPAERIACTFTARPTRNTIGVALEAAPEAAGGEPVVVPFSGALGAFALDSAGAPDRHSPRLAPGPQTIQAQPPAGWRVESITCGGDRDRGSAVDLAAGRVTVDLDNKEAIGCAFRVGRAAPRGSLTIRSQAAPAEDAAFTYTGDLSPFTLRDPSGAAATFDLPPGAYRVHELLHPLWALSALACDGDADGGNQLLPEEASAIIDLDAGERIACTFGHTRVAAGTGALTIVQTADGAGAPPFAYSGALGSFTLQPPAVATRSWAGLRPGPYAVQQMAQPGWPLGEISCVGDADRGSAITPEAGQVVVDVDGGESITCTFANARAADANSITILHQPAPADGTSFRYNGALGGFNLSAPAKPSRVFGDLAPGSYGVGVRLPAGWRLMGVVCSGDLDGGTTVDVAAARATIDLDAGEGITCAFQSAAEPIPPPAHTLYLPFLRR